MTDTDRTAALRKTFAAFPSGVTTVAALFEGKPIGFTLSSFTNVSLNPALVVISVSKKSKSWTFIRESPSIGVSILAFDQEEIASKLSQKNVDRFANINYRTLPSGAVFINDSVAWFETKLIQEIPAGDHIVVILEVISHGREENIEPLVHHSGKFRNLNYTHAISGERTA